MKEEPQEVILRAMEAKIDPEELISSFKNMVSLYYKEKFIMENNFGLFQEASMKVSELAPFDK